MATSSGSPPTSEPTPRASAPPARRRIAPRVIALFIASALVPLALCTLFLVREFSQHLEDTQREALDSLVRNFGMLALARLNSADDVLASIIQQQGADEFGLERAVHGLEWAGSVRRMDPRVGEPAALLTAQPDARQRQALDKGGAIVVHAAAAGEGPWLVRRLASGNWLYVQVRPEWLWADAGDYADRFALRIADERGIPLWATGQPPQGARARSWDMFLAGRFQSPSWRITAYGKSARGLALGNDAYLYLFGVILATILLISWLSLASIRRQLRPLEMLTGASRRVAQRDFAAFRSMDWNDEFGDLARSFDFMSGRLETQFRALETLADVDRLLLSATGLEQILDILMPRIASLLGCDVVSVILFDADSGEHARAFDHDAGTASHLPVRRISLDVARLKQACRDTSGQPLLVAADGVAAGLLPAERVCVQSARIQPLVLASEVVGALCVGFERAPEALQDDGWIRLPDLADRLSLILANLRQAELLRRQANYDALTGLQNRLLFSRHLQSAIEVAQRGRGLGGLLYIDLDYFKRVNDTGGHAAGDGLLTIVARRLMDCAGERASVARLGGDEFAVLIPSITDPDDARRTAERIIAALQEPILVEQREYRLSASIGICLLPEDGDRLEDLLRAGDVAMYHAKDAGRGRAVFFQRQMQQRLLERIRLEQDLKAALEQDRLAVHYQPILSEGAGGGVGLEALVRWPRDAAEGAISPAKFIPVAEETGLIVELGDWVLRSACRELKRWQASRVMLKYVSVNVSVRQLREPDYLPRLEAAIRDSGIRGTDLQLEITESVLAQGPELVNTLQGIVALGVRLALDDFGTGYSSLSYLQAYPVETVKIDASFVRGLPAEPTACRLTESIVALCAALGKRVVAEGVETEAQREFLRQAGCLNMQGFLLGRPMPAAEVPACVRHLLEQHPPSPAGDAGPGSATCIADLDEADGRPLTARQRLG